MKIRLDKNGRPYVITNGGVYRPQTGPHESPVPQRNWGQGIESKISIDAEVQVKHVGQSPFCKVRTGDGMEEMWTVHGHDVKSPEACFFERQAAKAEMPKPNPEIVHSRANLNRYPFIWVAFFYAHQFNITQRKNPTCIADGVQGMVKN